MPRTVNFGGPILGTSTYVNGVQTDRDVKFTLPTLTNVTAEIQAMGKHEVPLRGYFEASEYKGYFNRFDRTAAQAFSPEVNTIEHRWVQDEIDANGNEHEVGYKAIIKGKSKTGFPAADIETSTVPEIEFTMSAQSMYIYRDGQELLAFDRFSQTYRVNGKDHYRSIDNML